MATKDDKKRNRRAPKAAGPKGPRHHGTVLPFTRLTKKKFSDGIRSTFTAVSRYWSRPHKRKVDFELLDAKQDRDDFSQKFQPIYDDILKHYHGVKRPVKNAGALARNVSNARTEMPFYVERAYSDYVGIPTGLLLLFTNAMSDATQGDSKERVLNLLMSSRVGLDALIEYLNAGRRGGEMVAKFNDLLFIEKRRDPSGLEYDAHLEGLEKVAKAFHRSRIPRAKRPKKIG